ncbi:MFS transporter-like protein [Peziza echinospora]|nr:MFS transporter-like protein [Peziza echinospora]
MGSSHSKKQAGVGLGLDQWPEQQLQPQPQAQTPTLFKEADGSGGSRDQDDIMRPKPRASNIHGNLKDVDSIREEDAIATTSTAAEKNSTLEPSGEEEDLEGGGRERRNSRDDTGKRPWLLEFRSSSGFIQAVVAVAIFTDIFLYGLIIPVFPFALESRVGISGEGSIQRWVAILIAIYGAGLLISSPIAGYIADHTETRRAPLLVGLMALAGSTLMLCLGRNIATMVVGRLLQGISAAVVWSVGLALLVDTVGTEGVGKSMGNVAIALSLAILLAPLLGGVTYEHAGYYAVFGLAFALLGIDIALRLFMIEKKVAEKWIPGSIPESQRKYSKSRPAELNTPTVLTAVEGNPSSPPPATTTTPTKKRSALPPFLLLLTLPRLLTSLLATITLSILMTALETTLPLHVSLVFSFTPTSAGLLFLAITIPSAISPYIGHLSDTHGPKLPCTLGFLLCTPLIALLPLPTTVPLLCALLALIGATFTLQNTPVMAEITYILVDLETRGDDYSRRILGGKRAGRGGAFAQGYGLYNVAFSAGTMVGPVWAGFVTDRWGWGVMGWSLAIVTGVTVVPIAWYMGGVVGEGGTWWRRSEKKAGDVEGGGIEGVGASPEKAEVKDEGRQEGQGQSS